MEYADILNRAACESVVSRVVKISLQLGHSMVYSDTCAGFSGRTQLDFASVRKMKIRKFSLLPFPSFLLLFIFLTTLC